MKDGYNTIEVAIEEQNERTPLQETSSPHISGKRGAILFAIIAGLACLITLKSSFFIANEEAGILAVPLLGEALPAPDCTVAECFTSGCPRTAPFRCHSNNGCSGQTWQKGSCLSQCTLEHCTYEIPSDADTCAGVQCPEHMCKQGQSCGFTAPYQCLEGASRFGCNGDEFGWTTRTGNNVCSKCCDSRTC